MSNADSRSADKTDVYKRQLYNDAGDGYAYENGDCTVLDISYCEKTGEISEKLSGAEKYRRKIKYKLVR